MSDEVLLWFATLGYSVLLKVLVEHEVLSEPVEKKDVHITVDELERIILEMNDEARRVIYDDFFGEWFWYNAEGPEEKKEDA